MAEKCFLELDIDPRCSNMSAEEFRGFVNDHCFPPMWECMSKIRPTYNRVDELLDTETRSGSVNVECKTDFSGNHECKVSGSWSF